MPLAPILGETMSIKANILRDAHGNIIVQMQGDLSYEHSIPLRKELDELIGENPQADVTIDLGGIDFVGSSGICHFVETIEHIKNNTSEGRNIGISNLTSEFKKIFKLYTLDEDLFDDFEMDSDETQTIGSQFANRTRTFEN